MIKQFNEDGMKQSRQLTASAYRKHVQRIKSELLKLGLPPLALYRMESRHLPKVIHQDERIGGVVYGKHPDGHSMLIATDKRVIFLDKKPMFVNEEEISYDVVSGVSIGNVGFVSTVVLHTRIKDYSLRTFNSQCAHGFAEYIDKKAIEQPHYL